MQSTYYGYSSYNRKEEKDIPFKKFILTLDFLFIIDKIEIKEKDIIGLK